MREAFEAFDGGFVQKGDVRDNDDLKLVVDKQE